MYSQKAFSFVGLELDCPNKAGLSSHADVISLLGKNVNRLFDRPVQELAEK
jgi:hypothetical protein